MLILAVHETPGAHGDELGSALTEAWPQYAPTSRSNKATRLRDRDGFAQAEFVEASIDALPFEDASFDAVVSNGVINLSPGEASCVRRSSARAATGRKAR